MKYLNYQNFGFSFSTTYSKGNFQKHSLLIIFLIHFFPMSSAQCDKLISIKKDDVLGKLVVDSKQPIWVLNFQKNKGFKFEFNGDDPQEEVKFMEPTIDITVFGGGECIDDDAKINILFSDTTRIELSSWAKFNCDKWARIKHVRSWDWEKDEIKSLATKEIKTVRIETYKNIIEMNFSKTQSQIFRNTYSCLLKSIEYAIPD
ncbi:MAG: hypothetical protein IPK94_21030 [Saprospiraceae bacterium]|nr:hypothetical protein [Saprospiraceae bacterium]